MTASSRPLSRTLWSLQPHVSATVASKAEDKPSTAQSELQVRDFLSWRPLFVHLDYDNLQENLVLNKPNGLQLCMLSACSRGSTSMPAGAVRLFRRPWQSRQCFCSGVADQSI